MEFRAVLIRCCLCHATCGGGISRRGLCFLERSRLCPTLGPAVLNRADLVESDWTEARISSSSLTICYLPLHSVSKTSPPHGTILPFIGCKKKHEMEEDGTGTVLGKSCPPEARNCARSWVCISEDDCTSTRGVSGNEEQKLAE